MSPSSTRRPAPSAPSVVPSTTWCGELHVFADFECAQAGRVPELDKLAGEFASEVMQHSEIGGYSPSQSARASILDKAKSIVAENGSKQCAACDAHACTHPASADLYVKIMQKIIEKGNDYTSSELSRINRMIRASRALSDATITSRRERQRQGGQDRRLHHPRQHPRAVRVGAAVRSISSQLRMHDGF